MTDEHTNDEQIEVHEGRAAGVVVSVRLGPEDTELLMELQKRHGDNLSEILRSGLRALATSPRFSPVIRNYTGGGASATVETSSTEGAVTVAL